MCRSGISLGAKAFSQVSLVSLLFYQPAVVTAPCSTGGPSGGGLGILWEEQVVFAALQSLLCWGYGCKEWQAGPLGLQMPLLGATQTLAPLHPWSPLDCNGDGIAACAWIAVSWLGPVGILEEGFAPNLGCVICQWSELSLVIDL